MTGFIEPMYAAAMPKAGLGALTTLGQGWVAEEKYDGHRLIVAVGSPNHVMEVVAWSLEGRFRVLPPHLIQALCRLPEGVYDGELHVPGKRSYGVTELVNGPDLVYTCFDILSHLGVPLITESYVHRRQKLNTILFNTFQLSGSVRESQTWDITSEDDVRRVLAEVWARDGEGLILKRKASRYSPGKRPKGDWVKMKQLRTAVLTIIGFEPSKGLINNRGPYATVVLQDSEGYRTTVKTLNDAELAKFADEAGNTSLRSHAHKLKNMNLFDASTLAEEIAAKGEHPAIGRRLRIEYQERTPDGSYRHPRWDRWVEDDEEADEGRDD